MLSQAINMMNIRNSCPLCHSQNQTILKILKIDNDFESFINNYYGDNSFNKIKKYVDSDITYAECNNCKLIYQKNILSDKGLYELYEVLIDPIKSLSKRLSLTFKQNFRGVFLLFNLISKIKKPVNKMTIIDLGMGFGTMLSYAKALGCVNSYGIELSKYRADYAKDNFGIKSYNNLNEFQDNSIDIILSNQSLEHISDVRENLDLIESKLSVGGIAYIAVPNSSQEKVFLKKGPFQPFEHINSFIPKSKNYLFSDKMKYQFMLKNIRPTAGTIWLFKKIKL